MNRVNIVFIADGKYIVPTITAIYSVVKNKHADTELCIYVLTADMSLEQEKFFNRATFPGVRIQVIRVSARKYAHLHQYDPSAPCVATPAALLKFDIPNILSDLERVLYLDGDLIVKEDLSALYQTELGEYFLAAVVDSGSIYYKHKYVQRVRNYFNSGVMLLNLKKMRAADSTTVLFEEKRKEKDLLLMDQNVFNVVFDGQVLPLPIKYNLLYVNLIRAREKYTIQELNQRYDTQYGSLDEIVQDAAIIHYSSKDKPWKNSGTPLEELWKSYFLEANAVYGITDFESGETRQLEEVAPKVSVIIPVYNTEKYLNAAIDSVIAQSLRDIEIICVNDGSTDGSMDILKEYERMDGRIRLFAQSNRGQSSARNVGIEKARGKYVYFFDSDDLLTCKALEMLYMRAEKDELDLLLFDGEAFYDSKKLEERFAQYKKYYIRNKNYPDIYIGEKLYVEMVANGDYKVSPCLQFFRRDYIARVGLKYLEGIIYEDNLFALQAILLSERVGYMQERLFRRRVRFGSTVTSSISFRDFRGHYLCLQAMYLFMFEHSFSDDTVRTAARQFDYFRKTTCENYKQLNPLDKRMPWSQGAKEKLLSGLLYRGILQEESGNLQNVGAWEEIHLIRSSWSYRIGRFITFIPRKVRSGVRCYREHGWNYTFERVLVHLHLKKDPYRR